MAQSDFFAFFCLLEVCVNLMAFGGHLDCHFTGLDAFQQRNLPFINPSPSHFTLSKTAFHPSLGRRQGNRKIIKQSYD